MEEKEEEPEEHRKEMY
jgi:hypothetical protein